VSCVFVYRSICSNLHGIRASTDKALLLLGSPTGSFFLFCRYNFEMNPPVSLLTRSSDYIEWKVKMIGFLNRQKLFSVSDGYGRNRFKSDNDWLKAKDKAFEIMELALSPSMRYLSRSIKDPQELWRRLEITFGFGSTWCTSSTKNILDPKSSASTLSDEVVQDEEEVEASTQSIRIEDSLHAVTPSPDAPEVHEISDISSSHIAETEEDVRISDIEEKFCCTSMQTFTGDFPLNSVENLPVIASESEEKFVFSSSNVAAGVKICDTLDILEEISDYQSDPFAPHDLVFPANSCRIACTKIQNFEEEESCASTVSVNHLFESDINLIGSDMILFRFDLILLGLIYQIHNLSVPLVAVLINGVKKQVPQVSYKTTAGDLIPFHSFGSVLNLFRSDLLSDLILFGSYFKIQKHSVMLVAALTNSGVKNQVPHFLFKTADGDLVLVSSYEVADILLCDSLYISEAISDYGASAFALNSPSASLPLITCSSSHRTSKEEDFLHLPGHLLLTLGAVLTTHGFLFMAATYQFLECSSHSLNSQEPFLTFQLTSVALHGSSLHPTAVYISDLVEHIILLPKRNIPPDI